MAKNQHKNGCRFELLFQIIKNKNNGSSFCNDRLRPFESTIQDFGKQKRKKVLFSFNSTLHTQSKKSCIFQTSHEAFKNDTKILGPFVEKENPQLINFSEGLTKNVLIEKKAVD